MLSFKGILKYSIAIFIAVWMFVLGIMVGRGNSPITFDTRGFDQQLEEIFGDLGNEKSEKEQVDLEFFQVLDQPVAEEKALPKMTSLKMNPKEKNLSVPVAVPIKTSTKKRTFQKKMPARKIMSAQSILTAPVSPVKKIKTEYTIQIAAYKDFKDAVTQMTILEKKGIKSYREKGEKDGITWYRVRTGAFHSFKDAKIFMDKLNRIKIKAMIIKKDNNEDIKG